MNKVRTLTLALAALATLTGLATAATSVKSSKSNSSFRLLNARVTEVNQQAKVLTIAVVFSAAKLSEPPTVGASINITYNETPDGLAATSVKSSKSNSQERVAIDTASSRLLNATVTEVNNQAKTFTVAVILSAAKLSRLPTVGTMIDITCTETDGGPMEASSLDFSKSNVN